MPVHARLPFAVCLAWAVLCLQWWTPPAHAGPTARALKAKGTDVPVPAERPAANGSAAAAKAPDDMPNPLDGEGAPAGQDTTATPEPATQPVAEAAAETAGDVPEPEGPSACLRDLAAFTDAVAVASPVSDDAGCRIDDPVRLSKVGDVSFGSPLTLDCGFARAFAAFARDTAAPLALAHLTAPLVTLTTGPGFQCRRRNRKATGKLSEHALGNAVDISAFRLADGTALTVAGSPQYDAAQNRFFDALRKAACGHFTTVLGPGSDGFHEDHLHFDRGRMEEGKENPYRICQ